MTSPSADAFRPPSRALSLRLEPVDDPEFARVLRIGDPAPALSGALIFLPPANVSPEEWLRCWVDWQAGIFTGALAPALAGVAAHAAQGCAREIQTFDQVLDASLDPEARERSVAAGRRFLQRLEGIRGVRWLTKLQTWTASHQMPAHFLTIYAAQSALFHLPLRLLLPSYAYWEWCAAMTVRPPVDARTPKFAAAVPALRQMVESISPFSSFDAADSRPVFRAP
jgi:hypothetical protein